MKSATKAASMAKRHEASHTPVSGARYYARLDRGTAAPQERVVRPQEAPVASPTSVGELLEFDLGFLGGWIKSGLKWIALMAVLGAIGGFAFGTFTKPRYTASASIVVDPSNLQVIGNDLFSSYSQNDAQLLSVESKLRILTSGNVLARVVQNLDLTSDPEFVPPPAGFSLSSLLGGAPAEGNPAQTALESLGARVSARRDDRSFVVSVSAWTADPNKSVTVAHAVIDAFQEELAASDAYEANRAATALASRLEQLKSDVASAETAVERFKQVNNLQSSSGELVNAQSLTQINAQRNQAQVALAQAQSRYDELRAADANGRLTNDSLQSTTITALRQQYTTLKQQLDADAARLGPRHPTLVSLSAQLSTLQAEINREAQRLIDASAAEVTESKAVLASLDAQADVLRTSVSNDNNAQVELRALERDAQAKASVYEAFLSRTGEISERERIDATNVRVISPATPPSARSYPPRTVLLIAMGAIGGAVAGVFLALLLGLLRNNRKPSAREAAADEIRAALNARP